MDSTIKSSIKSYKCNKSSKINDIFSLPSKLNHISKLLEDTILKFTKKYLIVATELEEMKNEFMGQTTLISEYLQLAKKEILSEKFDEFHTGKSYTQYPVMPNYTNKVINSMLKSPFKAKINNKLNKSKFTKKYSQSKASSKYNSESLKEKSVNLSGIKASIKIEGDDKTYKSSESFYDNKSQFNSKLNKSNFKCNYIKDTSKMTEDEKKTYHSKILSTIKDPVSKAVYTLINSDIVPIEEKSELAFINKEIASKIIPSNVLNDSLNLIENKLNILVQEQEEATKSLSQENKELLYKLSCFPSAPAVKGINILNKDKEKTLFEDNDINRLLIEMIYSCLQMDYNENDSISNLYDKLFVENDVDSIKDLFLNVIYEKIFGECLKDGSYKNMNNFINLLENNEKIIKESILNQSTKTFSFVCFSLQDISEFLKQLLNTTEDNVVLVQKETEIKHLQRKINAIKNKLNEL